MNKAGKLEFKSYFQVTLAIVPAIWLAARQEVLQNSAWTIQGYGHTSLHSYTCIGLPYNIMPPHWHLEPLLLAEGCRHSVCMKHILRICYVVKHILKIYYVTIAPRSTLTKSDLTASTRILHSCLDAFFNVLVSIRFMCNTTWVTSRHSGWDVIRLAHHVGRLVYQQDVEKDASLWNRDVWAGLPAVSYMRRVWA